MFVSTTSTWLSAFHGLVQGIPIRDIDHRTAAVKRGKRGKVDRFLLGPKQIAQRGFHQLGHRPPLAGCFALEQGHDRIIDLQCRLHMANHTRWMEICQDDPNLPISAEPPRWRSSAMYRCSSER